MYLPACLPAYTQCDRLDERYNFGRRRVIISFCRRFTKRVFVYKSAFERFVKTNCRQNAAVISPFNIYVPRFFDVYKSTHCYDTRFTNLKQKNRKKWSNIKTLSSKVVNVTISNRGLRPEQFGRTKFRNRSAFESNNEPS